MKTTGEEEEEKRLQRNANKRKRYAQLSHVEKQSLQQKNKERYAKNKTKLATGTDICQHVYEKTLRKSNKVFQENELVANCGQWLHNPPEFNLLFSCFRFPLFSLIVPL